ncbi:MAG: iron ABC transporter permease [Candidatus Aminicenantes bacterium]|nr:iron ABC transporter permease [Candidatus Aminicenantes bacterium]
MATRRKRFLTAFLLVLPFAVFLASLHVGTSQISPGLLFKTLLSPLFPSWKAAIPPSTFDIVFAIRLPRLLLALAVGAALAVSGASLQSLFKNPLVNEYILGISSGAAFGASLSFVVFGSRVPPQISSFAFAVLAVVLVLAISRRSDSPVVSVLLTGVIVSAFFSALLSLVEYFASPYSLQALFFWLMGNLWKSGWADLAVSLPLIAAGLAVLLFMRWRFNVLSMSDEEARSLGVRLRREKLVVLVTTTIITAAATSVAGIIGWIGLIVPHLVRMIIGVDNRRVLPLSAALGATVLIVADDIARSLAAFEVPVGIFTSLIGIPLFIVLLRKAGKVWR